MFLPGAADPREVYLAIRQANIEAAQAAPESLEGLPDIGQLVPKPPQGKNKTPKR